MHSQLNPLNRPISSSIETDGCLALCVFRRSMGIIEYMPSELCET